MRGTSAVLGLLERYESRNVVYIDREEAWPIVWERARGTHVWDEEGRRYLDLTAAFGVAAAGHANAAVVRAARKQLGSLVHAMGDVHPHAGKALLARELSRVTFERWGAREGAKTIFGNSGFEAVEAALKTARLATGRRGAVVFEGAYHGLGYGALNATHRDLFRKPFLDQLGQFGRFVSFPETGADVKATLVSMSRLARRLRPGAVLVEPVQGRAGIRVPPMSFLPALRRWCDAQGALLVLDEIYTGFGRTGRWFACEHTGVRPDLICLGKALTGGFPMAACVGAASVMDRAWPRSEGEAIHTSTFLGHPVGCAMALAQIRELREKQLVRRSAAVGEWFRRGLQEALAGPWRCLRVRIRGLGLMMGVVVERQDGKPAGMEVMRVIRALLRRGYLFLPEGEHGQVISVTPPLTIRHQALARAARVLGEELRRIDRA